MRVKGSHFRGNGAFTLLEIVVVLGVVLLLAGLLGRAISGGNVANRVDAGCATAMSLVQAAQARALLGVTRVRLIVNNDRTDSERYLRSAGIVEWNERDRVWQAASGGTSLPKGVFFLLEDVGQGSDGRISIDEMRIGFPQNVRGVDGGEEATWLYLEFDSKGTFQAPGARIFVASGNRSTPGGEIDFDERAKSGFVIHRLGAISKIP